MKQLDRLLLFQGYRCFFCDEPIPDGEASVEHLVASAIGGTNEDDNCVACCKSLNSAFGSRTYKEKLRAVLNYRGKFICPRQAASSRSESTSSVGEADIPGGDKMTAVLADLQKRGASRPRKVATLKNTIAAVFQKQLSEDALNALVAELVSAGYVNVKENRVAYSLPSNV